MGVRFPPLWLGSLGDGSRWIPAVLCTAPLSDPGLSLDVSRPLRADCGLHPTASPWRLYAAASPLPACWGPEACRASRSSSRLGLLSPASLLAAQVCLPLDFSVLRPLRRVCVCSRESFVEL